MSIVERNRVPSSNRAASASHSAASSSGGVTAKPCVSSAARSASQSRVATSCMPVQRPGAPSCEAEPPQFAREVRTGLALAAALLDRVAEREQRALDDGPARVYRLLEVQRRGQVSALAIARPAGRDLVLRPRRAAVEPWDDVLEGQQPAAELQRPRAPHAAAAVAL